MVHAFGAVGMILVLAAYALASSGRIQARSVPFQLMNFGGAVVLVAYSTILSAWVSVALNVVWGFIALGAIWGIRRAGPEEGAGK